MEPEMCKLEWFLRSSSPFTPPDAILVAHKICQNTSFLHISVLLFLIIQTVFNHPKHLPKTEEARKLWTLEYSVVLANRNWFSLHDNFKVNLIYKPTVCASLTRNICTHLFYQSPCSIQLYHNILHVCAHYIIIWIDHLTQYLVYLKFF